MAISKDQVAFSASLGALAAKSTISVAAATDIGIIVTGTFTATVTFEASIDGTNWAPVPVVVAAGTFASTATAPGIFQASVAGFKQFRANVTAYTSGAAVVAFSRCARCGLT